MPLTFAQAYTLSQDWGFRHQCEAAALQAALAVLDEAGTVASHAERLKLAFAVMADPVNWCQRFATFAISFAASLTATPTDAVVLTGVQNLWTKVALAYAASGAV